MPSCAPHASLHPLHRTTKKWLGNGPPLIWLKPLKMIAFFTIRAMVKTTPETNVYVKDINFPNFYMK